MGGFIILPRDIFTDKSFKKGKANETFAFIDLIQLAEYKDVTINIKGQSVNLRRGELSTSVRILADRWGWSVNAVSNALHTLERYGKVIRRKSNLTSIISIVNYDQYQPIANAESNADEYADEYADKDKYNKINKRNNIIKKSTNVDKESGEAVTRLYSLYPSSVVRAEGNRVSLKSNKDKVRLTKLLKTHTEEKLAGIIRQYLAEEHGPYIKMFSTFLNNLPDYDSGSTDQTEPSIFDQPVKRKPQEV